MYIVLWSKFFYKFNYKFSYHEPVVEKLREGTCLRGKKENATSPLFVPLLLWMDRRLFTLKIRITSSAKIMILRDDCEI